MSFYKVFKPVLQYCVFYYVMSKWVVLQTPLNLLELKLVKGNRLRLPQNLNFFKKSYK